MEIALIGFVGVLIGAIISSIATILIAKWQMKLALQKTKVDLLQYKIGKFENLLFTISEIKISIVEETLLPQLMMGRAMLAFTEKTALARQYSHYFPSELVAKLKSLSSDVSKIVFNDKTGQTNDVDEVKAIFANIQVAEQELYDEIAYKLNIWQSQVEKILLEKS